MEVSAMAKVYYSLIKAGTKTIDKVPMKQRVEVEYLLQQEENK